MRDRYGRNTFGQCCLLARRLVEAGTRVVEVIWPKVANSDNHSWDVHTGLSDRMKKQSAPMLDAGLSALIADLDERGLLDETLVVAVGEFGRSPQRGVSTSGNGNSDDGRDHWPYCYTAVVAGAGVKRGFVYGKSDADRLGPAREPGPSDRAAGDDLSRRRHQPGNDRLQPPQPAARAGEGRAGDEAVCIVGQASSLPSVGPAGPVGPELQKIVEHQSSAGTKVVPVFCWTETNFRTREVVVLGENGKLTAGPTDRQAGSLPYARKDKRDACPTRKRRRPAKEEIKLTPWPGDRLGVRSI